MRTDRLRWPGPWLAGLLVAAACNGRTSYLDATGAGGHEEGVLGIWLTAVASAVVVFVCVAIIAAIARKREGDDVLSRRKIASGLGWIYVGLGITVVVLLITFGGTMVTLNAASRPPHAPRLVLDVTAHQWWWEVRYIDEQQPKLGFVTANEVHLPVGEPVLVRLHSADVIHSFWIPQLAGKRDVIPGQVNEMWLEPRQAGHSSGMCGEYCGLQHAHMGLDVVSESPAEFARWAAGRRAEAAPPATPEAQAGRTVFVRSCGACHAVEGTNALGRVGPDLTHVASRPAIAAGLLPNTAANLALWVRHAPDVKEGSRMPAIPLDDQSLAAVVAYLQGLH